MVQTTSAEQTWLRKKKKARKKKKKCMYPIRTPAVNKAYWTIDPQKLPIS